MLAVATSRYHNAAAIQRSGLLAVSVSIGMPKWPVSYDLVRESPVRSMCAPWGLLQLDLDEDEFRAGYLARLEKHGPAKILRAAEQLASEHGREGVVLLCWEDASKAWCHRRMLAEWLERAGIGVVPEL